MATKNVNINSVVILLVAIGLLGYALLAQAGDLEPPGAPGSTMKTLDEVEPRIPISQSDIPLTINESGSYYFTEDINSADTAITVAADDVTIDLAGFTLAGPDSGTNYGIYMSGRSNVEIRNGTVHGFHYGIGEDSSLGQGHRVIDVRALSNGATGIYLKSKNNLVKDCTARNNGYSAAYDVYGIYAGSGSTVTGNTACDNGDWADDDVYGIYLGGDNLVDQNTASNNGAGAGSATDMTLSGYGCVYGINVPNVAP